MLEDGFAEVYSDHHLVTKWAELSVGGPVAGLVRSKVSRPVQARLQAVATCATAQVVAGQAEAAEDDEADCEFWESQSMAMSW